MSIPAQPKTPGRNDPCPCGSGKKYKKCCMGKLVPENAPAEKKNIGAIISEATNMLECGHIESSGILAKEILAIVPGHPDANHILGLVEMESGNLVEAEFLLLNAVKKLKKNPFVQLNLAKLYERKKEFAIALGHAKESIKYDAELAEAHNCCGSILLKIGEADKALFHFKQATKLEPTNLQYVLSYNAGLHYCNRIDEARRGYQKLIKTHPSYIAPYINLAAIYRDEGKLEKAVALMLQAIIQEPNNAELYSNLGSLYSGLSKFNEEIDCYKQAITVNPKMLPAYSNLMGALKEMNRLDEMYDYAKKIIQTPELEPLLDRATSALASLAALDELKSVILARAEINKNEIRMKPPIELLSTNDLDYLDVDTIYFWHRSFGEELESKANPYEHGKVRCSNQRIRIGYVSPDFRAHSVGFFIRNVLKYSNLKLFDIYCYSSCAKEDDITEEIKNKASVFRKINYFSAKEVAKRIYEDEIDILIDLAGYTEKTRIAAFAFKPAPVQIAYLGYPNTTGLKAVDYRITDHYADVDGGTKYTESLVCMPECFISFGSFSDEPIIDKFPFETKNHISFGSFNSIRKLNRTTIELWSSILKRVPDSRLVLKSSGLDREIVRKNIISLFSDYGITEQRLSMTGPIDSRESHLAFYNTIDIALATFPYNGTTTTCEALWMGVPVITLVGKKHAQRVSYSILKNIGVEDTIAYDRNQYLDLAVGLAKNTVGLRALKVSLRDKLKSSILCDTERFTRQLEELYGKLWQDYCLK